MPEFGPSENLEVTPLLEALRSEPKVIDSGLIYSKAMERLNTIKEDGTLDGYILRDEEAATLCSIPLLVRVGLDFSDMASLCKEKTTIKTFCDVVGAIQEAPTDKNYFFLTFGEARGRLGQRAKGCYL